MAVGSRILVYEPNEGTVIQPLKAHKDAVHCLSYSRDGKYLLVLIETLSLIARNTNFCWCYFAYASPYKFVIKPLL